MAAVTHLGLFPWCVDPDTSYFSREDLLKYAVPMWWRVKSWGLEVQFVRQANTSPPQNTTINLSKTFNVTDLPKNISTTDTFQNEKDLVCAGVIYDQEAGKQYRPPADHTWGIDAPGIFIDSFVRIGPSFDIYFDQDDMLGARPAGSGDKVGEVLVKMQGLEFTVGLFRELTDVETQLYRIVSLNATLEATEYWPYDPEDGGGPIYDSTTGVQKRER